MPLIHHRFACGFVALLLIGALPGFVAVAETDEAAGQIQVPQEMLNRLALRCGTCHAVPPPASIPKKSWQHIIEEMAQLMAAAKTPMTAVEAGEILRFYQTFAPEEMPAFEGKFEDVKLKFSRQAVGMPPQRERPTVTHVKVTDLDADGKNDVLICDNDNSQVSWLRFTDDGEWVEKKLASAAAPVHCEVVDHDGDGDLDIAVASMGFMHPNEQLIGSALLLLNDGEQNFTTTVLVEGTPRISDVQPGDFDNDGDVDYLLAMFGWRSTGGLAWVESRAAGLPSKLHPIADVNGAMLVEPVDYDGDGLLDFVALLTQQHEALVAYKNHQLAYLPEVLARGPHPAYGSSGFELVDLDADGDLDIVMSNGDYMDTDMSTKNYHGVRWMENDGNFQFSQHHIVSFPGCYRAVSHDMDGDGDLDIVASSLFYNWKLVNVPSLIWMENDGAQNFTARKIDEAPTNLATVDVGDINHDGIPDIIAGGMHVPGPLDRVGRLTVWLGEATAKPKAEAEKKTAAVE